MHVVATAGHVDHGKSTLVRALTGMEPDRWAEERRRGMTIDLGFVWTTLDGGVPDGDTVVAFVDVPGHERFVPTMVAGVGPVPAVLFVVAADEGWRRQSSEHLAAIDAFEVSHGLLVITRADLADPAGAMAEAQGRLANTSLAGIEAVAVSARTGEGLDDLRVALAGLVAGLPRGDVRADVRLWVDRSFVITGAGTIVTGTLTGGHIGVGDTLTIASSGRQVGVRAMHCLGRSVPCADPVARVALNLRGVDHREVGRGEALLSPGRWLHTDELDVRVIGPRDEHDRDGSRRSPQLSPNVHLTMHIGTAAVPARLRPLGDDSYRLRLARALPLRIGDHGLLREPSNHDLLLGVTVLDPQPPVLRGRGAAARRAELLAAADVSGRDVATAEVARRGIVSLRQMRRLGVRGELPEPLVGDWVVDAALRAVLSRRLGEIVDEYASRHPLEPGLPVAAATTAMNLPDASLVAALLPPGLVMSGGRIGVADSTPRLPAPLATSVDALRARLADNPFAAPSSAELSELGLGHRELAAAARAGAALVLPGGVVLLPDAPALARERLVPLPEPFTVSEAKQAWQTSRRVAIPLLELLDGTGATERLDGGTRRLSAS